MTSMSKRKEVEPSVLHNCREGFGIERRAADQSAVNFLLRHEGRDVLRLHRSAIKDAEVLRKFLAEDFRGLAADYCVRFRCQFRSRGLSGANRPDRLIYHDEFRGFLIGDGVKCAHTLPP